MDLAGRIARRYRKEAATVDLYDQARAIVDKGRQDIQQRLSRLMSMVEKVMKKDSFKLDTRKSYFEWGGGMDGIGGVRGELWFEDVTPSPQVYRSKEEVGTYLQETFDIWNTPYRKGDLWGVSFGDN